MRPKSAGRKTRAPRAERRQGDRRRHGRRLRRRGDGGDRRRHDRQEGQTEQVRHRLPAARAPRSYWKIPLLNRGESPVKAEDPEVDPMIAPLREGEEDARPPRTTATVLKLADCVVVDVQCDYVKNDLGNMRTGEADMAALEATHADHRREDPAEVPRAHRDDRRAGHDRVRRVADPEEGLRGRAASSRRRSSPTASSA